MNLKYEAANQAVQYVKDGMTLGLGSGSTSAVFVDILGEKFKRGEIRDIVGVPTSEDTAQRARGLGIPLMKLEESASSPALPVLDLAVDGADEVDPQLNLIKGLGRALLREKITEIHARRFIVIVDESKIVSRLGRGPLPVEIVPFGAEVHVRWLNSLGCRAELWVEADGSPVVTDNHNYLARCWFDGGIPDAYALDRALAERPGIVEHGLFLDMATEVVVAGENGIRILERGR
jgi:ribose 5-phosphate isomerase A